MARPAYSFTIPSLHDDLPLDCRIYHPEHFEAVLLNASENSHAIHGAVLAHPYAPMGGCYDDPVVTSVAKCLLQQGYVVGTFNFRGAPGSKGSTSWTGRAEREDYISFAGFMLYYLHKIQPPSRTFSRLSTIPSVSNGLTELHTPPEVQSDQDDGEQTASVNLLLSGYSYGSLILSRLPPISATIDRFEAAERGTAAAEVLLRARRLARETEDTARAQQAAHHSRGRQLTEPTSPLPRKSRTPIVSPVVVGGEETNPSERRRSQESTRSASIIRKGAEVPARIKAHIRRRSSGQNSTRGEVDSPRVQAYHPKMEHDESPPQVVVRYLLISPLLPPVSHALVSPATFSALLGTSKGPVDKTTGMGSLQHPTLAIWGASDPFTSNRRLKNWSEKVASQAQDPSFWTWAEIEKGGHFWREPKALQALLEHIVAWLKDSVPA